MSHEREQARGLHADGFTACIGTTDEQATKMFVELERNRDDRFALLPEHGFEQWMTRFAENQFALGPAEPWNRGIVIILFYFT